MSIKLTVVSATITLWMSCLPTFGRTLSEQSDSSVCRFYAKTLHPCYHTINNYCSRLREHFYFDDWEVVYRFWLFLYRYSDHRVLKLPKYLYTIFLAYTYIAGKLSWCFLSGVFGIHLPLYLYERKISKKIRKNLTELRFSWYKKFLSY